MASPKFRPLRFAAGVTLALLGTLVLGCDPAPPASDEAAEAVYLNGHVVTVSADFGIAEAFAVTDGRFVAVGSSDEIGRLRGPETEVVDLEGRTVLPGFVDNHIHLGPSSEVQAWEGGLIPAVAEWSRAADTPDKLFAALAEEVARLPAGTWIRGGLTRPDWPNDKVPTRWELDRVAPDHPVLLTRGPHTYVLNSLALSLAGIDEATPDPEGGWIFRDEQGRPNGRVLEAARRIVNRVAPEPERPAEEEGLERMRAILHRLEGLGITSVNVAGVRPSGLTGVADLYKRWGDELPRATVQVRLSPGHDTYDDAEEGIANEIAALESLGVVTGSGHERFKIGAIKMSIDGGLSAPVFWALEPYPGRPDFYGAIRIPADVFYPVARRAHELGWQLGIHTMGDGAVEMVVDQMERILDELPRENHRHYLHHVAVKPPERTIRQMAALDIGVASQPAFTIGLGAFAKEALTPEREQTQNPTRSLQEAGIRVSHGSDSAPYGPLLTIWTAVTRRGWDGAQYGPAQEAVSVEEAIRLHTLAPASFTFDENDKGSIEAGKLADFVVLSDDILSIDPEDIRHLSVLRTVVGGRQVFPR